MRRVPSSGHRHYSRTPSILALLVLSGILLAVCSPADAQPLPVTRLAYSAKFICGSPTNPFSPSPAPNNISTYVELHNPHSFAVTCSVKVVEDFPAAQVTVPQYAVTVGPNGTLRFECADFGASPAILRMGFVEIISPRQVKVVAVHRDIAQGTSGSVAIGKKTCPGLVAGGLVRHSATVQFGPSLAQDGTPLRNDSIVSVANLHNVPVNATISIVNAGGPVVTFPKLLPPNGFATVTQADLPPATPLPFVGGVTVQYPDAGIGWYMEVEEILKEYVGGMSPAVSLSVIEVQPVTLR